MTTSLSVPPPAVSTTSTPKDNLRALLGHAAEAQRRPLLQVEDLFQLLGPR